MLASRFNSSRCAGSSGRGIGGGVGRVVARAGWRSIRKTRVATVLMFPSAPAPSQPRGLLSHVCVQAPSATTASPNLEPSSARQSGIISRGSHSHDTGLKGLAV